MDAPSFQQYGWLSAAATTVDMGLYATTIQPELMHQAMVFSFYFPFMLVVQVSLHALFRSRAWLLHAFLPNAARSHFLAGDSAEFACRDHE